MYAPPWSVSRSKTEDKAMTDESQARGYRPLMIRDLDAADRPRERLRHQGAPALSNAELLAIMLRIGVAGESALQMAQRLLSTHRGLAGLAHASFGELAQEHGIGTSKTARCCPEYLRQLALTTLATR